MQPLFNTRAILPADFFHIWAAGKFGRIEQRVIGSAGTHDGLFVNSHTIGESTAWPPRAHLTDLEEYEEKMRAGRVTVSILRIPDISLSDRYAIAGAWFRHVKGTFYDFRAIAKMWTKANLIKNLPPDSEFFNQALGWEFAHFCTEGLRKACIEGTRLRPDGIIDPLAKENPTPRTVENRLRESKLVDVSGSCLTAEGLNYRLIIPERV